MDVLLFIDKIFSIFVSMANLSIAIFMLIVTIGLLIVTYWNARITKDILKSNNSLSEETTRPYIVIHLYSQDGFVNLQIKNIGKRPAKEICINFKPDLKQLDTFVGLDHEPLLKQKFIPPDFAINQALIGSKDFVYSDTITKVFTINISYYSMNDKHYNESYDIDLSSYIYAAKTSEAKTLNGLLVDINKSLEKIGKSIEEFPFE